MSAVFDVRFNNQWQGKKGSRDITWVGIEHSSFQMPLREANIHIAFCGLQLVVWYKRSKLGWELDDK